MTTICSSKLSDAMRVSSNYIRSTANSLLQPLYQKICEVVRHNWDHLHKWYNMTTCYIGAKSWSIPGIIFRAPILLIKGIWNRNLVNTLKTELFLTQKQTGYQHQFTGQLSKDVAQKYRAMAYTTAYVHENDYDRWMKDTGYMPILPRDLRLEGCLDSTIEVKHRALFDPHSGLHVAMLENADKILIVFGVAYSSKVHLAADDSRHFTIAVKLGWQGAMTLLSPCTPSLLKQADRLVGHLIKALHPRGKEIIVCGQCIGGAIGQYVSLKRGLKAVCFNSLQIGPGVQAELGLKKLQQANELITHIIVKSELYNDFWLFRAIDYIWSICGIKTPGNFGNTYWIPTVFSNAPRKSHNFMCASYSEYIQDGRK